jgi:hypothetical protein
VPESIENLVDIPEEFGMENLGHDTIKRAPITVTSAA